MTPYPVVNSEQGQKWAPSPAHLFPWLPWVLSRSPGEWVPTAPPAGLTGHRTTSHGSNWCPRDGSPACPVLSPSLQGVWAEGRRRLDSHKQVLHRSKQMGLLAVGLLADASFEPWWPREGDSALLPQALLFPAHPAAPTRFLSPCQRSCSCPSHSILCPTSKNQSSRPWLQTLRAPDPPASMCFSAPCITKHPHLSLPPRTPSSCLLALPLIPASPIVFFTPPVAAFHRAGCPPVWPTPFLLRGHPSTQALTGPPQMASLPTDPRTRMSERRLGLGPCVLFPSLLLEVTQPRCSTSRPVLAEPSS